MAYINTGVLGQVLGGSLGTAGLGQKYQQFAEGVKRRKRTLSGPSASEREAVAARRQERLDRSLIETNLSSPVDTADVKVPAVSKEAGGPKETGITSSPAVAPAPAPAASTLAPERQYSAADKAFGIGLYSLNQHLQALNSSDLGNRRPYQAALENVQSLARATGNQSYIEAVSGIRGLLGQKHVSARNVGQAKTTTSRALQTVRNQLDVDTLFREAGSTVTPLLSGRDLINYNLRKQGRQPLPGIATRVGRPTSRVVSKR